ncbi:hypothetical protein ACH4E8_29625 [Streptomyces sp. NPDC017979]|uniref:hypothetical protein n=1 Tax=Streptomyces sp. NPDC017979 TaxID=3365024 RepID=UPI0037938CC8
MRTIAKIRYQIDTDGCIPADRVAYITEAAGHATAYFRPGHATAALCERLTALQRPLLEYGQWVQDWDESDCAHRADKPAEGRSIARASWEIVPARLLPDGVLCFPVEKPGAFVWMIREKQITAQCLAEMNAYCARIVGDGLWRQQWGG